MRIKLVHIVLLLSCQIVNASEIINIGIFDKLPITSFSFQPEEGSYTIYSENGKVISVSPNTAVDFFYSKDRIVVKSSGIDLGSFKTIKCIGTEWKNSFKVKVIRPKEYRQLYEDNLLINVSNFYNHLQLINNINIDNYVSGVVEAEVGTGAPKEYFKLQAIICRTYALKNIDRHKSEGFSLCGKVHCQAYHGKPKSKAIVQAAKETESIVIVDSEIDLITATFYSNCGGQTANSEEVWKKELYYLRSIKDTFCLKENNSKWTKKIKASDWYDYLSKHNYPRENIYSKCGGQYFQNHREQFFLDNNIKIPMVKIRKDWRLKSTQFDIIPGKEYVTLNGLGFGHGVGLCQEGAMKMAEEGYSYAEILHFYYQDVHMINLNFLDFFKEDL